MNIVCFPSTTIDLTVLQAVLRGGLRKMREAGTVLAGGHSVEDPEMKYGLAVTGVVHPDRVLTKQGVRPGDRLVLTKPLGTGILSTALKADLAGRDATDAFSASMSALNRAAGEAMLRFPVHACTDITGFGLLGHLCEMIEGDEVGVVLDHSAVPILPEVAGHAEMGLLPAGLHRNREYRAAAVEVDPRVPLPVADILFDPQTSGGLLIALPEADARELVAALRSEGVTHAAVVGEAVAGGRGRVQVR
jgi:selenide,water dikinase